MTTQRNHDRRPRSASAWFLGRPAHVYIERFGRRKPRPAALDGIVI
jgi:hypothetical protein